MAKCQFFNKVFGKYASFQSLPALLSDSVFHRFRKIPPLPLKVRSVGYLPCYTAITPRDGSPSPINRKKRGIL